MKSKYEDSKFYSIVRPTVKILFLCLYRPKILGKENIPPSGRVILAGNHTNIFDCLMLMSSAKRGIHFLAKKELWKGAKKIIFSNMGLIPVDRKSHDHKALEEAENYLKNERLIAIFPEGTTSKNKENLLPFKIGAVKMAYDTNTMIVPFSITGNYKLFSRNLKIKFGKPYKIKDSNLDNENKKLKYKISSMIKEAK